MLETHGIGQTPSLLEDLLFTESISVFWWNFFFKFCDIVAEHKKMSSALDKCPYCFNNIPKHLIVAIGMKVRIVLLCEIMIL